MHELALYEASVIDMQQALRKVVREKEKAKEGPRRRRAARPTSPAARLRPYPL